MNAVPSRRRRGLVWGAALLGVGALAGVVAAITLPAAAQNLPSGSPAVAATDASAPARGEHRQRPGETLLTGADAEKATAAAKTAVPGATVDRVETDADGAAYEAHVTKPDGSRATVKFDKDFNVTGIEDDAGRPGR
jgi:hypothetical protein